MSIELPEGLMSRPATAGDIPALVGLIAASEEHDDGAVEIDADDLVMDFGRVGFDPGTDAILVFDGSLLVGWAELYRERADVDVRPSHRGRGVGSALLAWAEARARESGLTQVDQIRTDGDGDAKDLFGSHGYGPKWNSWILRIELGEPTPPAVIPAGIAFLPYDPSRDERATHRLWENAMSAVRGREPEPFDVWASQTIAHANFDPALSRVALAADDLVATLLAYDIVAVGEVWIGQVATEASYRRRGIASALLREVFTAAREIGRDRCGLSTDSVTGARALYERQGMRVVRSYTRFSKTLP